MKINEQIKNLKLLNLPADQFMVVSSGTLAIRGIREAKDIDIIPTESLWNDLSKKYSVDLNDWGIERINLPNDIEVLNPKQSIFGNSKIVPATEIFERADIFKGIKFMNLNHLRKVKEVLGRPIDIKDISLIDKYLENNLK